MWLAFLCLLPVVAVALSPCPVVGCDGVHSNAVVGWRNSSVALRSVWTIDLELESNALLSCVGDGGQALCVVDRTIFGVAPVLHNTSAIVWQNATRDTGRAILLASTRLAVAVFADGPMLQCFHTNSGADCGPTIHVVPSLAPLFNFYETNDEIMVFGSRSGPMAAYLSNGVPQCSLWLNVTLPAGDRATYVPAADPVVDGQRVYVYTRLRWAVNGSDSSTVCRLYAIEARRTLAERFLVLWFLDIVCASADAASVPPLVLDVSGQLLWVPVLQPAHNLLQLLVVNVSGGSAAVVVGYAPVGSGSISALAADQSSGRVFAVPAAIGSKVLFFDRTLGAPKFLDVGEILRDSSCLLLPNAPIQALATTQLVAFVVCAGENVQLVGVTILSSGETGQHWVAPLQGNFASPSQLVPMCITSETRQQGVACFVLVGASTRLQLFAVDF